MAEPSSARAEASIDLVHTALDATRPAPFGLVPHGVGQELDRLVTGDAIAVEVEQRVELGQALATVPAEQRETGGTQ
ncbi:MAG TPA: hypothetical protein VMT43_07745 [Acidimicrobiales bacterium]|nr:hypothetical protein [Acidimicrobiales bacterium]